MTADQATSSHSLSIEASTIPAYKNPSEATEDIIELDIL